MPIAYAMSFSSVGSQPATSAFKWEPDFGKVPGRISRHWIFAGSQNEAVRSTESSGGGDASSNTKNSGNSDVVSVECRSAGSEGRSGGGNLASYSGDVPKGDIEVDR
ncbi:uncharacterized protein IL334_005968 [Kwoniella shivajii]|uniref:Uncharacterized protein n=1 Tax=Kwoniella shivajii TaxID=564305 RepID=A0ABZ1D569_9TREE|nr:hypothetical protein IL334_005968 [Kwoniella shivajii]